MNRLAYRKDRVKVSEQVESTLYGLLVQEQDTQKKKKHPAGWYRDEVAKQLGLAEENNPSLRSYESYIRDIREKLRIKNPLDKPWCIGQCMEHDIPDHLIPLLIRIKEKIGDKLTIRKAKWMGLLHSAIENLANEQNPGDIKWLDQRIGLISREYAIREQFCEVMGKDLDTSDYDTLFFVYEDLSEEAMAAATVDNIFSKRPQQEVSKLSSAEIEQIEAKVGKLTDHELETFYNLMKAQARGGVAQLIYMHEHSEDIEQLMKKSAEVKNERTHNTTK